MRLPVAERRNVRLTRRTLAPSPTALKSQSQDLDSLLLPSLLPPGDSQAWIWEKDGV